MAKVINAGELVRMVEGREMRPVNYRFSGGNRKLGNLRSAGVLDQQFDYARGERQTVPYTSPTQQVLFWQPTPAGIFWARNQVSNIDDDAIFWGR